MTAPATVREPATRLRHTVVLSSLIVVALAIALPVFLRLSNPFDIVSDIPLHAALAPKMIAEGGWISYSLWYPLLYVTSGFSSDPVALQTAAVVLLTTAVVAKTVVGYVLVWRATGRLGVAALGALVLLLAMPLVNPFDPTDIYLGQITANVWHNSTNILVAPFALAAFAAACTLLRRPDLRQAALVGALGVVVVLMKPNYMLALLPALGLLTLWSLHRSPTPWPRRIAVIATAFAPPIVMLAVQYVLVFLGGGVRATRMGVAPFAVWSEFSEFIPLSIVLSVLGPLVAFVALPAAQRRTPEVVLGWSVLGVAVAQLALLAEIGASGVDYDGNWFWGAYTAMLTLMYATIVALGRGFPTWRGLLPARIGLVAAIVLLAAHAASGLIYALFAGTAGFPVA